ncbi:hypothetical protein E3O42_02910 [Cryobacterium adonitolivorans]|uniref:HutD family protein n=1 Tax=Cryobacterium adonitolivorans TaxID=1259189 RepID=A0A4R8WDW4_9MICO|nr:hypothetical protein [Cryobacterium adonitolivorans]TFC05526.1 hypothetical protein E3O42_02910 [Cryobacterium adonitolivorans]
MSIAAEEDDGVDAAATPPRIIRFSDLPRQPLDQGRGSAREVWADLDSDLTLRWQLRVVEIKDSTGLLVGPAGTHHYVVGLAGPQIAVRNTESNRVLRRDHVMPVLSSTVYFERPKLRPPGASSLFVLTFTAAADPPEFVIRALPPETELRAGSQLLLALRGTVRVDGVEAAPGSALLLDPTRSHRPQAVSAQVLTVHRPGAHPVP